MGGSMLQSLKSSSTCRVCFYDIDVDRVAALNTALGMTSFYCNSNAAVANNSNVVVLAIEPKDVPEVCKELSPVHKENQIYVSLAAGVTLSSLAAMLPANAKIVRVMPNTPCVVGEMAAGYICNDKCNSADISVIGSLLGSLGSALRVADESDIDAVTGVSGSGPAYVFQFIEALSDGGVRMGLSRQVATELAAKCVRGAATMVLETGKHPGALKDEVTSPGGTTIAAVHALEMGGMRAAVINAVVAATEKSRELGRAGAAAGKKRAREE